ncbi:hypothetical protein AB0J21_29000 [Streptomyces sp. NPDC049954]|uniref:hypothetical protein n=1 Tax=Streptomyces sp. NPDC049954 TaxID=3155779 RepID=UPI003441D12F
MDTKTTAGAAPGGAETDTEINDKAGVDTPPQQDTDAAEGAGPTAPREEAAPGDRTEAGAQDADTHQDDLDEDDRAGNDPDEAAPPVAPRSAGTGLGAGAVVSAALGFVSLSGSWIGTVAGDRQSLVGQLKAQSAQQAQSASDVREQLHGVYGDSWHLTAWFGGAFALVALLVGVFVLVRPAFGAPGRVDSAPWVKSVAWGGVVLAVIGLVLAVLKVTDVVLGIPSV